MRCSQELRRRPREETGQVARPSRGMRDEGGLGLSQRAESSLWGAAWQREKEKKKLAGGRQLRSSAGSQAEKAPCPQPRRGGLGTLRSSGASLGGGCGTTGSLALSGASTGSTSGSPVPAFCRELRMTASGRPGAPVSLRPSIPAETRSCCHPWRPGAAAAGGEAGPASHPLLPGSPRIWDQQARDLLKTPKADFKHNQIAQAKPSLPSDSFKCHKRCVAAKIAAPLNGPIICSAQSHKFPHPGIST